MNRIAKKRKEMKTSNQVLPTANSDEKTANSKIIHLVWEKLKGKGDVIKAVMILIFATISIIFPLKTITSFLR